MKPLLFALGFASFLSTPLNTQAAENGGQEFTFRFAPAEGTKVKQLYRSTRERIIGDQPPQKDESEARTRGQFSREGESYVLTLESVETRMHRNGQVINDPLTTLLAGRKITYVVGSDGTAKDVQGYSGIEKTLKNTLSPALAAALAPYISEAALVAKEKAEWDARYADFADGTFAVGDVIDVKSPYALPGGGQIDYLIRTSFPGWEACPAGQCVRIIQRYESDTQALASLANKVTSAITSAMIDVPPAPDAKPNTRITGGLSRLIDPATMLIYSETVERIITMPMNIPEKGMVQTEVREQRSYDYSYE